MNRRRGVADESSDEDRPKPVAADSTSTHKSSSTAQSAGDHRGRRVGDGDGDDEHNSSEEGEGDRLSDANSDSSDESSDDNEDEIAKVRDGFIVYSDEDDEEETSSAKKATRKRRRHKKDTKVQLDEDDLDLLGLSQGRNGETADSGAGADRFKRLKRASEAPRRKGLDAMFDDDALNNRSASDGEDESLDSDSRQGSRRGAHRRQRELDDFIESDVNSEDEYDALRREEQEEIGYRRPRRDAGGVRPGLTAIGDLVGLDEEKLSEIQEVFGDGEMYDWALQGEEDLADVASRPPNDEELQLTDVFEPSELAARMLTTEDNQIRSEDLPERFQLLRQRLQHSYDLDDDAEYFEKKQWVADALLEHKKPLPELREPTRQAANQVIDCISRNNLEVPFIWHHRQDYLVHFSSAASNAQRTQLLDIDDLWRLVDLDLEFHGLIERRRALSRLEKQVDFAAIPSALGENVQSKLAGFVTEATSAVEYQDLIEYIQFVASSQLRAARRHSRFAAFDRIREGPTMELVESLGINTERVATELAAATLEGVSSSSLPHRDAIIEPDQHDPALTPTELANELGSGAVPEDAITYVAHAFSYDPRLRRFFRHQFEQNARVDLNLTDDGRRKITMNSPFADLKYSYNWTLEELRKQPATFLRMLRAENQGLVIVRLQFPQYKTTLYKNYENLVAGVQTDTSTEGPNEWNQARQKVVKASSRLIVPLIARNILQNLRADCIRSLRYEVRSAFATRLNQAPYKPPGYVLGTVPRVFCISSGEGNHTDAVIGAVVDEDGHVSEVFKLGDQHSQGFNEELIKRVKDVRPDVVGVAGFTPVARRLFQNIKSIIVDGAQLMTGPEDAEQALAVVWVKDEVARLYRNSERAAIDFPDLVPNARYCVALARYLQNPLLEYAQLDSSQLKNLVLHKDQALLPDEEFSWAVETAFVDIVCMEGVDINQAARSSYHAATLPYVSGMGPRKASGIIQSILSRAKGGKMINRTQLVFSEITSRIIFMNCASFLRIPWSKSTATSDYDSDLGPEYLDATRIHPEDYELARKMCADALELDEEDVEDVDAREGGVVGQLLTDDPEGKKLDELVLEEYAEELEQMFKQRKRITLELIRREVQDAYGELRLPMPALTSDEIFTMLTGETRESIQIGSIVSGTVKRVTGRQLIISLSGGIDGVAEAGNISDDRSVPLVQQFAPGQAVQAEVLAIDYGALFAHVNTRHKAVLEAAKRFEEKTVEAKRDQLHWNSTAEKRDISIASRRSEHRQRQLRVIKHPLFRPFSAKEAEAFLAPLQRGDLVIRPSSLGMDHLVVTWKVSDQIYQHIDVLELDKPNEYALGRTLQIGQYRYSDLDELIIMHVQSMARKVDEMGTCEKFQKGNRKDVEKWLSAYTNARPTQSVYAFCFDHRRPGYFFLCYMLGANQPIKELHVKVLPNGYELLKNAYTDVQSLTNGFKMMVQRSRV